MQQSSLRVVSQASQTAAARSDGVIPTAPVTGNAPHTDKAGFRKSYCNTTPGFDKDVSQHAQQRDSSADCRGCCGFQTLPREAWTMNIHAIRGSADDSYRYNPWRAPGTAPVRATPRVCSKQLHLPTDAA